MEEDKSNLDELKEQYKAVQEKYSLPDFEVLNKDFQIEKICESETEFLLREIRKYIADKFSNYLRFIEGLLHPSNVQLFVYSIIKTLGTEEREKLTEAYKELAKCEVSIIRLDIDFSEEDEAKFIKESFEIWGKLKKNLLEVVSVIEKNWDNKFESNGKGYFG